MAGTEKGLWGTAVETRASAVLSKTGTSPTALWFHAGLRLDGIHAQARPGSRRLELPIILRLLFPPGD